MGKSLFVSLYWVKFSFVAAYIGITSTTRLACSNGKVTLSGDEALRNARITSSIIEYFWKARYSQNYDWTDVIYCNSSAVCVIITSVLPYETEVQVSANGTSITLEHRAGGNASDHAQFLFEVHLVKNSAPTVEHLIFKVDFTVICIHTRIAGKANLTKFLLDKLPWDHVTDVKFTDANTTEIAYCNTGQCVVTVNKTAINPSLNWTNRFDVTDGTLVLTDIQKDDNGREIGVQAHVRESGLDMENVHLEKMWILVNISPGTSHTGESESHSVTDLSRVTTSNTLLPTTTVPQSNGVSPFSKVQSLNSTSPLNLIPCLEISGNPTTSSVSAARGKVWTVVISVIIAFRLSICLR